MATKKNEQPADDAPALPPYVIATALNVPALEAIVADYIRDGYACQGGVACMGEQGAILQAMRLDK